jgi:Uma2 family endonuclease
MVATTRAAEGLARRAFTVAEIESMQRRGIFHPDEKFELVEGEIVPMQAKSPVHELIKTTLIRDIVRALPDELWLGVETTLFLSERTALDPDLSIFPSALRAQKLAGPDVLLAIEVSHSTLSFDRGLKARLYARFGVPEYCVIDAKRRRALVHVGPSPDGTWAERRIVGPDELLSHPAVPAWKGVRLGEV